MQEDVTGKLIAELTGRKEPNVLDKQERLKLKQLTKREVEVLRLLGSGLNKKEVAKKLYISEGTVKNHISSILQKLEIRDRTQAALFALKAGLPDNIGQ